MRSKLPFIKTVQISIVLVCLSPFVVELMAQDSMDAALNSISDDFKRRMSEASIVGGALVILQDDRVLLEDHLGLANAEKGMPAQEETIYCWGSITKTITCIAVMQLQLHGRLRIDDPVVKYIPAFSNVKNPYGGTENITLKMLMSHTSGLQNSSFITPTTFEDPDYVWPRWEQLEPVFNYIQIENEPGERYSYSNLGLLILGRVIEVVTKDDYEVYVDKNILKPLEMFSSYFDTTPYFLRANKAQGYFRLEENQERKLFHPDVDQGMTTSNGGLKTSIRDFKKYMCFLIGSENPALKARYDAVLPRQVLESMWKPVKADLEDESRSICLGFFLYSYAQPLIGHTGSANGFISSFYVQPGSKLAWFVVGNTWNFSEVMNPLGDMIIDKLIRK
jgi:CubicO group peptidase (beta-lactamase class C family)